MPESKVQSDRGFSEEWQSLWSRVAESMVRMADSIVQNGKVYGAGSTVQNLQCKAYSAEPTVQSLQCRVAESTMQIGKVDSEGLQRLQPGVTEPTVQSGRGYRAESQTTDRRVLIAEWQSLAIVQS